MPADVVSSDNKLPCMVVFPFPQKWGAWESLSHYMDEQKKQNERLGIGEGRRVLLVPQDLRASLALSEETTPIADQKETILHTVSLHPDEQMGKQWSLRKTNGPASI